MKILLEDAVLFLISFYLVIAVISNMAIFDSVLPGQRWNPSTNSLETYTKDASPSIFGNTADFNETLARYGQNNQTIIDANSLLNPLAIVAQLQYYLSFVASVLTSPILAQVLTPFIGWQFAGIISFILSLMMVIVAIRVLSGRLRWS